MVGALATGGEGFLLGLATSHVCAATCGPVYAAYLLQRGRGMWAGVRTVLEISAGRFVAYAAVGALAGYAGRSVLLLNRTWFTASAYVLLSAYLLIAAFRVRRCQGGCASARWHRFTEWPVALGLVSGINFCPSFLIALTRAAHLAGPLAGVVFFMAFFAGSSVLLFPFAAFGALGSPARMRTIARIASVAVAAWFTGTAVAAVWRDVRADTGARGEEALIVSFMDSTALYVLCADPGARDAYCRALAGRRPGPVIPAATPEALPESCLVVAAGEWREGDSSLTPGLLRPGRFVVVAPGAGGEPAEEHAAQTAAFLARYHFKHRPATGSLFVIPFGGAVAQCAREGPWP